MYLPPYTPELSPAEGRLKLPRKATWNVPYEGIKVMEDPVWAMPGSGEVWIARMCAYLS